MKVSSALLSARSYITILVGFLIGFAVVVWVERQMPTRVESSSGIMLSDDFPPLPDARPLTFDEAIWARVAWQYFVNNSRPDGLVNAQDGAPWFSLWSTGSYLLAAVSAYRLDVITRDEFDERISQALFALGELPLTPDGLPAAYYRGDKQEILGKPESSAIGVGRLLMALQVLLWHYPQHAPAVNALLSHWHLDALFVQAKNTNAALAVRHWVIPTDEPRDSFGYRTYASH
ncbi:DUF3131 domain-containing protein, partial [Cronobacter sakazakii]